MLLARLRQSMPPLPPSRPSIRQLIVFLTCSFGPFSLQASKVAHSSATVTSNAYMSVRKPLLLCLSPPRFSKSTWDRGKQRH